MRSTLLSLFFCSSVLWGCKKFGKEREEACFIPYVDYVVHQVDPTSLQVSFTAVSSFNGNITSHKWEFGDGTSYLGQNPPPHQYPPPPTPGGSATYRVRYTVANECGQSYWTKDIVISGCLPDTKFSFTHLNDSTVQFTNLTSSNTSTSYVWNFGDGTTSNSSNNTLTHVYQQDQNFTVSLKATNSCGENNFTATVPICRQALPSQSIQVSGCGAVSIDASATKNGGRYQWDFGNGAVLPATPSPVPTINYVYPNPGNYTITLKVINAGGCDTATVSGQVNITTSAIVPNNSWSAGSDDLEFNFSRAAVTNATSYNWLFGDGTQSNLQNPGNKTYADPGMYNLTLNASNGCGNTHSFSVNLPVPFFKALNNLPNTGFQDMVALSPMQLFFLGTNGKMYKADTAGNWSSPINLPQRLQFNNDTRLFKDIHNNLWIYGRRDVAKFNLSSFSWTSYFDDTDFSNNTTIESMAVDHNGTLWTIGDGRLRRGDDNVNAPNNTDFSSIAFAPATNRIWAVASNSSQLFYINSGSMQAQSVNIAGFMNGGDEIKVHPNGEIFFTSGTGIIRTNGTGGLLSNYNLLNTAGHINGRPKQFGFDEKGNLWVLLSGRLFKLPVNNSAQTKKYSFLPQLENIAAFDLIRNGGTDTDIIIAKTASHAAIKIK